MTPRGKGVKSCFRGKLPPAAGRCSGPDARRKQSSICNRQSSIECVRATGPSITGIRNLPAGRQVRNPQSAIRNELRSCCLALCLLACAAWAPAAPRPPRKTTKILRFGGSDRGGRGAIYNLSRPEKSRLVRAMLAKEAGGLAVKGKVVFKDTNDPLYRLLVQRVKEAQQRMRAGGRFDLPGFRPNPHYIREMQRFGILPKDLKPSVPLDPYAVDRAYFRSFDHRPKTAMR